MVFQVIERSSRFNQKFKTFTHNVVFKIDPPASEGEEETMNTVKKGLEEILAHLLQDLDGDDLIGFTFESQELVKDAYFPFRPAYKADVNEIYDLLTKIFQSNTAGLKLDTFKITSTVVKRFRGGGRKRRFNFQDECRVKKGVIAIQSEKNLCLPTALVVSKAYCLNAPNKIQLRRNIKKILDNEVAELIDKAGVIIPEAGCGFSELELFQSYLQEFQIVVYEWSSRGRNVLFKGPVSEKKLNLLFFDGHFNVITKLTAAFSTNFYCENCHTPFSFKYGHKCDSTCDSCRGTPPCASNALMSCLNCRRVFKNQSCFEKHLAILGRATHSVCERISRCPTCLGTVFYNMEHRCNKTYCRMCHEFSEIPHLCYMPPAKPLVTCKKFLFIFFDLETRGVKDKNISCHVPILCVSNTRCNVCLKYDTLKICSQCCEREHVFAGKGCIEDFISFVLDVAEEFNKVCVIAHNMGGFDGQFILKQLLLKSDIVPELLSRGTRIIKFTLRNIRFLDSLHYLPFKLAQLPDLFELGCETKKGYFPHLFNTESNADYLGPMPPPEFYAPDKMTVKDRSMFLEWYLENENKMFNLKQEMLSYCRSDVDILTKTCIKFREMFLNECNVDVFMESATIASACNLVFRRNYLLPKLIGILPPNGYRLTNNQSKIALQWLIYEDYRRGEPIQHAGKGSEAVVDGYRVDGYSVTAEGATVFEFLGCYWHGCPKCFKRNRTNPLSNTDPSDTLDARYARSMLKLTKLMQNNSVVHIWECDFRRRLLEDPNIEAFTANHQQLVATPLKPREGFYGGRVCAAVKYYKCKDDEKIKYADITSLYPWVCKYGKTPVGHPKIYVGVECDQIDVMECDGMIKCEILPNQNLLFPILPLRLNGKLMFVLCRTCGSELYDGGCQHEENERSISGVWVIEEVREAVKNGYEILNIYEVWEYETIRYDPETKKGGVFTEFINTFLKIKQENSGWPENCSTEEARRKYIKDYEDHEGVSLEYERIQKNESCRSLAKLMLNSFWGKFGQRETLPVTEIIKEPYQLSELLENQSLNVLTITELSDDCLVVSYEHKDTAPSPNPNTNVVIAAFTTAIARLKLYSYLKTIGRRVLYYDTDSIIYISRQGEPDIPTGVYLGDMSNELLSFGEEAYINQFCSGGPKNYAFQVLNPLTGEVSSVCKVKGITMNYETSKLINFDKMKEMVLNSSEVDSVKVPLMQFKRTPRFDVFIVQQEKSYRTVNKKRKFMDNHHSVPYGYKKTPQTSYKDVYPSGETPSPSFSPTGSFATFPEAVSAQAVDNPSSEDDTSFTLSSD